VPAALATSVLVSRRLPRALSWALLLALPVFAIRAVSGVCADALADRVVFGLSSVLGPVSGALPPATPDYVLTEAAFTSEVPASRVPRGPTQTTHGVKHGVKAGAAHGIHISAAQVLNLAAHRAMPDAVPVRANAEHPAGLQLRGVSALGVGLQDGDVLTEAAGQHATSVAAVVGIVLSARAHHSSEISGRFVRAGIPYSITVEQPYPPGT
jgi:hypothetical protein